MVKVRTLVPLTHPESGEQVAAGAEVDVSDEVARDWKADGKISFLEDEQAAEKTANEGNYTARTGREEAGGKNADDAAKAPAPPPDDDTAPKSKKS
jgi:hypothetical protein